MHRQKTIHLQSITSLPAFQILQVECLDQVQRELIFSISLDDYRARDLLAEEKHSLMKQFHFSLPRQNEKKQLRALAAVSIIYPFASRARLMVFCDL